jgi:hypothetical protein
MDVFSAIENGSAAAVACPAAGNTTIATIANTGRRLLCFHFDVATQALDAFVVQGKAHASAQLVDFSPANWAALDAGGRFRARTATSPRSPPRATATSRWTSTASCRSSSRRAARE